MSKISYVCFRCRKGVRREASAREAPTDPCCPDCGDGLVDLGRRIEIPPRRSAQAWKDLHEAHVADSIRAADTQRSRSVSERHAVERQIAELERRLPNPGVQQLIRQLRKRLEGDEP